MSFAVLKAAHRHSDILNAMIFCKHAGFVCVYVHKLWGFFYFFFIIWCRDAMNSLATVTMEHFDSWLCLDASPSGQCMPGIRWWAVWESDVTKGGGLRRAASVDAWYIRHYVQGWAWNVFLIQDMRMPNSDSSILTILRNNQAIRLFLHWKHWEMFTSYLTSYKLPPSHVPKLLLILTT